VVGKLDRLLSLRSSQKATGICRLLLTDGEVPVRNEKMDKMTKQQIGLVVLMPALATIATLSYLQYARKETHSSVSADSPQKSVESSQMIDPPILKNNSTFKSYTTRFATYPSIRTFYHPHPRADKLPSEPHPIPLLVFIHGLGGSMAQFAPLLGSLVNIAPCLGIDLPGCGLSKFSPKSWEAYTVEALAALLKTVIEEHQVDQTKRGIILVGHSMGCSLAALLASKNGPEASKLDGDVLALVAICPKSSPPTRREASIYRTLLSAPDFVLNGLRWLDRRGGTESSSVTRFVGKDAGIDLKKLQERYNEHFPTPVWKRMAMGLVPAYDSEGIARGGLPGKDIWAGVEMPLLLIAGDGDTVTKPEEVAKIVAYLQNPSKGTTEENSPKSEAIPATVSANVRDPDMGINVDTRVADDTKSGTLPSTSEIRSHHSAVIKTAILPSPASHALLYDHENYRTVAGLVEDFLAKHVSEQLGLGWQLQKLTTSGKWDVKNLAKWKRVVPVSEPIGGGVFRALKTLREQDEEHTPSVFVKKWNGKIYALIDISHESPIYDPKMLEQGGIQYHKFPTVSKIPPTPSEVEDFIALVERLRNEIRKKLVGSESANRIERDVESGPAIGVHCHYGYNRTGFFIVCYLIEKEGYRVQEAIDEFAKQRPPGIRHDHFIDTLFVRYCLGLRRAPSIVG
jgi:pimeloyl-ACP methyl ester carboxylesterase/protein-tyrosine phosphatase